MRGESDGSTQAALAYAIKAAQERERLRLARPHFSA